MERIIVDWQNHCPQTQDEIQKTGWYSIASKEDNPYLVPHYAIGPEGDVIQMLDPALAGTAWTCINQGRAPDRRYFRGHVAEFDPKHQRSIIITNYGTQPDNKARCTEAQRQAAHQLVDLLRTRFRNLEVIDTDPRWSTTNDRTRGTNSDTERLGPTEDGFAGGLSPEPEGPERSYGGDQGATSGPPSDQGGLRSDHAAAGEGVRRTEPSDADSAGRIPGDSGNRDSRGGAVAGHESPNGARRDSGARPKICPADMEMALGTRADPDPGPAPGGGDRGARRAANKAEWARKQAERRAAAVKNSRR